MADSDKIGRLYFGAASYLVDWGNYGTGNEM